MIITITGPSGSGKSYISNLICSMNPNTVHLNIDEVGHMVLELPSVRNLLSKTFGLDNNSDKVDRKKLGEIVFNNQDKMQQLTDITWEEMQRYIDKYIEENKDKIIILDWILIPKTKYFNISDLNILVEASFNTRKNRAMNRDSIDEDKFNEREQATLDFSKNSFDYIIENNNDEGTLRKVKRIYDKSIVSR